MRFSADAIQVPRGQESSCTLVAIVVSSAFDKTSSLSGLQTAHVFSTQKRDPGTLGFDRIDW